MIIALGERGVDALVLDIEGTSAPVGFVYDVLYPYAHARLGRYLHVHAASAAVAQIVQFLRAEYRGDAERGERLSDWREGTSAELIDSVAAYAEWLMARDRKSPGLKLLQGLIWDEGYAAQDLRGEVFPDVPAALERWREAGIGVAIYSSGSELAQRRLFGATAYGDLTRFINHFFDTSIGAKTSPQSYTRIAAQMGKPPGSLLFISDAPAELSAAEAAGWQAALAIRPGNRAVPEPHPWPAIRSFDEIVPSAE